MNINIEKQFYQIIYAIILHSAVILVALDAVADGAAADQADLYMHLYESICIIWCVYVCIHIYIYIYMYTQYVIYRIHI